MPLALLFGRPNSGKSTLAAYLQQQCLAAGCTSVHVVSPESLGFAPEEQISRAADLHRQLHAFVQRTLSQQAVVVVDFTNHTKSFRYELFCVAREKKTKFCIVRADFEQNGGSHGKWSAELYENVSSRFEELLERSDWDRPVFRDADSACAYLLSPGAVEARRSTQPRGERNFPLSLFLNVSLERVVSSQSTMGTSAGVQLYENVYAFPARTFTPDEVRVLKQRFTYFWAQERKDCVSNQEMALLLKEWLEQQ